MEYLGYVAANNPPPNFYLRRPPQPPQRSNSTGAVSANTKLLSRARQRTNSSDSSGNLSSHETGQSSPSGVGLSRSNESRRLPPLAGFRGSQPQNRHEQKQDFVSLQSAPTGNHNIDLPSTPLPPSPHSLSVIVGGSDGVRLVTTTTTTAAAALKSSPAVLSCPPTTTEGGSLAKQDQPSSVVSPKRKIRKHQTLFHGELTIEANNHRHESRKPNQSRGQEEDQNQGRDQDQQREPNQSQTQSQERKQGVEQEPILGQSRDPGWNKIQEQGSGQDTDQRTKSGWLKQRERETSLSYKNLSRHDRTSLADNNTVQVQRHQRQRQRGRKHQQQQHISYASIVPAPTIIFTNNATQPSVQNETVPGASSSASLRTGTMLSSEPPSSADGGGSSSQSLLSTGHSHGKPFVTRNGRTYLADSSLPYPLPVDLAELHRQSLRSLLLFQLFGGPVCSSSFANKPPTRVLEVGCGSAFWSIMCNQYYTRQGHRGISFSGIDIAPIGLGAKASCEVDQLGRAGLGTDNEHMNWRFVQHDIRRLPWPFEAEEFDLVMIKDVSLAMRSDTYQLVFDECIRLLQPGGTVEVWDSDHAIRLLRPHLPSAPATLSADEEDDYDSAVSAGAYILTPNTPLSAPLNSYIVEYNTWLVKALESRSLPFAQCALAGALFLQEAESLANVSSRRLAVPLSEMRWEREGVGGVVTKDGKTYVETKNTPKTRGQSRDIEQGRKIITPAQAALRRTALLTVVQLIQSLEPILREASGKSQDEWDGWSGKMMNDLMKENGTFWGECLEVGAWWAQKR